MTDRFSVLFSERYQAFVESNGKKRFEKEIDDSIDSFVKECSDRDRLSGNTVWNRFADHVLKNQKDERWRFVNKSQQQL